MSRKPRGFDHSFGTKPPILNRQKTSAGPDSCGETRLLMACWTEKEEKGEDRGENRYKSYEYINFNNLLIQSEINRSVDGYEVSDSSIM